MISKRKKPGDYPQFTFRVDAETKDKLSKMVEEVTNLFNKNLNTDEYIYRKNDIIIEALLSGLSSMKKKGPSK